MTQTVLILGATGRFGRSTAEAFETAGWTVRRFDRQNDTLAEAAKGADVIVAGWNPQYQDWAAQVADLHAEIRKAALANDATVIVPGNVYVFGPDAPSPWNSQTPHRANNQLGLIRRQMEDAYRRDGVKTILLRAGDFLDTQPSGNWYDRMMAKTLPKGTLTYPGATNVPHAWAFLPDVARAVVALAEKRAQLGRFVDIPFPGYTLSGDQMARILSKVLGRPIRTRQMSWLPLRLAWPFMPVVKHLFEMRYLWTLPHSLDETEFRLHLPEFEATPPEQALAAASAHVLGQGNARSTQTSR